MNWTQMINKHNPIFCIQDYGYGSADYTNYGSSRQGRGMGKGTHIAVSHIHSHLSLSGWLTDSAFLIWFDTQNTHPNIQTNGRTYQKHVVWCSIQWIPKSYQLFVENQIEDIHTFIRFTLWFVKLNEMNVWISNIW